ncbi:CDP-diacylglycerol-phosphatidylglycerol phosphatidyltransferase [Arthrobacter crystallopoietes BAB-32]|uniref:CDP-diacylglycerol-phosphatidylglycerol phosphatidyltransferase n=1 Tax=Arthrobacter crystallopoietes BAB-32 TaxID=1246476 RepID=N1V0L6_9MICC|nr:CDP-alcohol phosphatidyltransferase family protein [Arthrobacter crystallopoietes]EMY33622.1 CDP-diacylglycerol-phosphatidylglycerol phosphatidyltransferase [Arthrobacter crystallopoietes BAB-32]
MKLIGAGTRGNYEYRELHTFWTVPNLITVLRFLAVPLFVWLIARSDYLEATIVLAVLGSTDWVDGYIARRFDQISSVGRWLDPLADRLAMIIVAATFFAAGIAPLWLLMAIVVPDAVLLVFALALFRGSPDLPVTNVGKIRTALLLAGTPLLLLHKALEPGHEWLQVLAYVLLVLGSIGHFLAWLGYMRAAWKKYRRLQESRNDDLPEAPAHD